MSCRRTWLVATICSLLLAAAPAARADSGGGGLPTYGSPAPAFAVGRIVRTYVDHSRLIRLRGGRLVPRRIVTVIRYPAMGPAATRDVPRARPALSAGPFPIVVFGHGYAVTPAIYWRLLHAWAAAGYVVAAPVFPLGNAYAPGGPDEADIVNQPQDMSFVITRLLAASAAHTGVLGGLIDPDQIAVSGQSDGGSTALAAAYNSRYRDPRIRAAVILSGAMLGVGGYAFDAITTPLLAVQGTADVMNIPASTYAYFKRARHPKFLLSLLGAAHLPPYTTEEPQLGIVERTSIAFLGRYLKHARGAAAIMRAASDARGVARLTGW